jgi:arginase family enzyme
MVSMDEFELHTDSSKTIASSDSESKNLLIGLPFDRNYAERPGQSLGPLYFRLSWELMQPYPVRDIGNIVCGSWEDFKKRVKYTVPKLGKFVAIGGDHSVTIPIIDALRPKKVVIFDAHKDMEDDYLGMKEGAMCTTRRVKDLIGDKNVLSIGNRDGTEPDFKIPKKFEGAYLSLDLDVLDPTFAPGVSVPCPGGMNPQELLSLIEKVKPKSADIVELNPMIERNITPLLAAHICRRIFDIL